MPGPYAANLILIEAACRHIARGALAIEELGKRYDRTYAALSKAQQIISASKELMAPPPVPSQRRVLNSSRGRLPSADLPVRLG